MESVDFVPPVPHPLFSDTPNLTPSPTYHLVPYPTPADTQCQTPPHPSVPTSFSILLQSPTLARNRGGKTTKLRDLIEIKTETFPFSVSKITCIGSESQQDGGPYFLSFSLYERTGPRVPVSLSSRIDRSTSTRLPPKFYQDL